MLEPVPSMQGGGSLLRELVLAIASASASG
jgi:hypothetical protein